MAWPSEAGSIAGGVHGGIKSPHSKTKAKFWIAPQPYYLPVTFSSREVDGLVRVTATSVLPGTVYYYWYIDGSFVARTTSNQYSFYLAPDEQADVSVIDSTSPSMDAWANAPKTYPARRTLWWTRPDEADIDHYRVEQNLDAGGWTTLGKVRHYDSQWSYSFYTQRLTDLGSYAFRVYPVDVAGNDGTAVSLSASTVARVPLAVDYTIEFDSDTTKVTFTEVT